MTLDDSKDDVQHFLNYFDDVDSSWQDTWWQNNNGGLWMTLDDSKEDILKFLKYFDDVDSSWQDTWWHWNYFINSKEDILKCLNCFEDVDSSWQNTWLQCLIWVHGIPHLNHKIIIEDFGHPSKTDKACKQYNTSGHLNYFIS